VALNYLESTELPEFRAGDDVILDSDQSSSQSRGQTQRGWAVNYSRQGPQRGVLKYTLDAFRADFSLNDRLGLSQTRRDSSRALNLGLAYNLTWAALPLRWERARSATARQHALGARLN
jgi:hypothetical protein